MSLSLSQVFNVAGVVAGSMAAGEAVKAHNPVTALLAGILIGANAIMAGISSRNPSP